MYNNLDLNALSIDDIVEEYKLLNERHQQLKERREEDAQRIHELKRSLDTALAAEKYLTQELEQLSIQAQAACPNVESRMQQELEELRRKYRNLQVEHEALQLDNDAKLEETVNLKAKLEATARDLESRVALSANSLHDECTARLNAMEKENAELMQKLAEFEDVKVQNTFAVAEQEKSIEILKDQVSCLEENLRGKRDELEEKLQLLESSQEQLVEANAKIALLSSAPETNDRKGNSLFAEVDDQRQVMKHLLASQKKSYLDMKKIFNESKFEIHRLKRENIAMHTQLQACSTIFCSADKTYQNKLNERIRQLMAQNVKLERDLNVSQERLRELARQKSVTWLDSMLDFCKRETDELKTQLHSMHIQKATIDEQMRNVQQEMARWRFESLKSRCVLIDRENLLTEHKITFKPVKAMEFDIKEAQIKAALPRIVSVLTPTTNTQQTSSTEVISMTSPLKAEQQADTNTAPIEFKQELSLNQSETEITVEQLQCKIEPEDVDPPTVAKPVNSRFGLIKVKDEQELLSPKYVTEEKQEAAEIILPNKPNRKGTPVKFAQIKSEIPEDKIETLPSRSQLRGTPIKSREDTEVDVKPLCTVTPVRVQVNSMQETTNNNVRSIMVKKRDLFAEDSHKNVQFSRSDPIVHNLSPLESSKENENPVSKDIKLPKKSQHIIRRVVVPAKNSGLSLKK
ncbi:protein Spindly [Drosophila innubila]|uniref:protein Spindly n=1 Tax=Drosophila innubila TaxID=198719 RepID=UPI00148E7970|nr:protein Spindly [Drosophila innubila]